MSFSHNLLGLVALLSVLAIFYGCTAPQPDNGMNISNTSYANATDVIQGNNQFAMDLYAQYNDEEGNVFFSPFSISSALAMTYEGADGQTAEEMASVMHFPENDTIMREGYAALMAWMNQEDKPYEIRAANALWVQQDLPLLESYTGTVRDYYRGEATSMDFRNSPEPSRMQINSWVEEQTNDRIKDLLQPGMINPDTKLVLTNAVYFKGKWAKQFDESLTKEQDFRTADGTKKAWMMHIEDRFSYTENDKLQMLEMQYSGDDLSMLVILPKNDDLASVEMTRENLDSWKQGMVERQVDVYFPRFKLETSYSMSDTLRSMGMGSAFSDSADFSGMTGKPDLKISEIVHKAFVEVDEEGTEAAAATAVVMVATSAPAEPPEIPVFRADHPFIFLIQEKESGNILFMGKVADPS